MIELNNNKEKNINFEVQLSGINSDDLNGYLRMEVDGVEYGFSAKISESSISVLVPNLKNTIHRSLRESEVIKSKLEIFGNGHYFKPWEGEIKIKSSVMIEAKITEESSDDKKPEITLKENKKQKPVEKPVVKEKIDFKNLTKEHLFAYMRKNGTREKAIQEAIYTNCIQRAGSDDMKKIFKELYNFYKK